MTGVKHCKYICTNYSHRFQQKSLIFLLGANGPGAKRLWGEWTRGETTRGRNDQGLNDLGRNAARAKRLRGELDLGRNDPDSAGASELTIGPCFVNGQNRGEMTRGETSWGRNTLILSE